MFGGPQKNNFSFLPLSCADLWRKYEFCQNKAEKNSIKIFEIDHYSTDAFFQKNSIPGAKNSLKCDEDPLVQW